MRSRLFAIALLLFVFVPGVCEAQKRQSTTKPAAESAVYTCPMHPDVKSAKPGKCPRCGMTLRLVNSDGKPVENPESVAPFSSLKIPNSRVSDQNGRQLDFYNDLIKGKIVAINFIFTTCTASCPPLTATFRKVQQEAAARGLDIKLISVSVDPVVDTPERLRAFAEKYNVAAGWTFVTGEKGEIDSLLTALGVAVADKNQHTPMVMIGNDEADYWTRAYGLSAPTKLVDILADVANRK